MIRSRELSSRLLSKVRKTSFFQSSIIEICAIVLSFSVLLGVGLAVYRDYGYSTDEVYQRKLGYQNLHFIFGQDRDLLENTDRFHGPIFEIALVPFEKLFGGTTDQGQYFARHLGTFLFFVAGVFAFYLFCRKRFGSWKLALLGSWMLVISPRIFGNAFYNSKDIPFMVAFIASMLTLAWFLERPNLRTAILHGVGCAFLMAVRLPGALTVFITGVVFGISWLQSPKLERRPIRYMAGIFLAYIGVAIIATIAMFPYLWQGPVQNFISGISSFSRYEDWGGKMLYLGQVVSQDQIPWHYALVWILVTTPILYTLMFLIGSIQAVSRLLYHAKGAIQSVDLAVLLWLMLPLAAAISRRSIIYNSWRHLFFIYPAFLYLGLIGVKSLTSWLRGRIGNPLTVTVLSLFYFASGLGTVSSMVTQHPYQGIYFHPLLKVMGIQVEDIFDMDYWGLSYRPALEYILETDPREKINVMVGGRTGMWSAYMLAPFDRNRLNFVEQPGEAHYYVTTRDVGSVPLPLEFFSAPKLFTVNLNDIAIAEVYRMKLKER